LNIIGIIPSKYDNRPYVPAKIQSPNLKIDITIYFLIDTGATRTTISSDDANRYNLYNNKYLQKDSRTHGGIGGGRIMAYILPKCKLIFELSGNDDIGIFNLGDLSIHYPKNMDGSSSKDIKSMLGMDVLKYFDILFEGHTVTLRRK